MNIKGKIQSKDRFIGLLRALAELKKTGTLLVTDAEVERRLFLENGAIVAAASSRTEESFGSFLVGKAILQEHTLHNAEKLLEEDGALLGQQLVDLAVMSEDEVQRAIRLKVEKTLSDILSNPEGSFELVSERLPDRKRVDVSLDPAELLSKEIQELEKDEAAGASSEIQQLEDQLELDPVLDVLDRFQGKYAPTSRPDAGRDTSRPAPPRQPTERVRAAPPAKGGFPRTPVLVGGVLCALLALSSVGYWLFHGSSVGEAVKTRPAGDRPSEEARAEGASKTAALPQAPAGGSRSADLSRGRRATGPEQATSPPLARGEPSAPKRTPSAAGSDTAPHTQRTDVTTSPPSTPKASPTAATASASRVSPGSGEAFAERAESALPASTGPEESTGVAAAQYPRAQGQTELGSARGRATTEAVTAESPPGAGSPGTVQESVPTGNAGEEGGKASGWNSSVFAAKPALVKAEPASEPAVQPGDLVEPGPDVIDPVLLEHPKLKYPKQAKRQKIETVVRVRVLVDEKGNVLDAKIDEPVGYGLDEAALSVARRARFIPATKGTVFVRMWTVLPLEYRLKKKK